VDMLALKEKLDIPFQAGGSEADPVVVVNEEEAEPVEE
jgi:hypothetical protein